MWYPPVRRTLLTQGREAVHPALGDTNTTKDYVAETVRKIKQMVPLIQRKMYLANRETEFILFRLVRSNILSAFVNLLATLRAEYSFDDQTIIWCSKQEQLAALLASIMVVHVWRSALVNHEDDDC